MEEEELLPPPPKKNATTVAVGEGELLPPPPKKKSEPTPEEKGVQSTNDLQSVSPQGGEQPSGSGVKDKTPTTYEWSSGGQQNYGITTPTEKEQRSTESYQPKELKTISSREKVKTSSQELGVVGEKLNQTQYDINALSNNQIKEYAQLYQKYDSEKDPQKKKELANQLKELQNQPYNHATPIYFEMRNGEVVDVSKEGKEEQTPYVGADKDVKNVKTIGDAITVLNKKQQQAQSDYTQYEAAKNKYKADLQEHVNNIDIKKPTGFFDAITEASKQNDRMNQIADMAQSGDTKWAINKLNQTLYDYQALSELYGSQQDKSKETSYPIIGTPTQFGENLYGIYNSLLRPIGVSSAIGAAGGIAGTPLTGAALADAYIVRDSYKTTYAATLFNKYNELKQKGLSDEKAFEQANEEAKYSATTSGLSMAGGLGATKIIGSVAQLSKISGKAFTQGIENFGKEENFITKIAQNKSLQETLAPKTLLEVAKHAATVDAPAFVGTDIAVRKLRGEDIDLGQEAHTAALPILLNTVMAGIGKAGMFLKGGSKLWETMPYETKMDVMSSIAAHDPTEVEPMIEQAIDKDIINRNQANELRKTISDIRSVIESLPSDISPETFKDAYPLVKLRQNLQAEADKTEVDNPHLQAKIEAVDRRIQEVIGADLTQKEQEHFEKLKAKPEEERTKSEQAYIDHYTERERNYKLLSAERLTSAESRKLNTLEARQEGNEKLTKEEKADLDYLRKRREARLQFEPKVEEAAKEETIKRQQEEETAKLQEQKTEANDKENITGVSGEIGIGQEPIETQPIEEGGGGASSGGGILEKAQEVTPTETVTETVAETPTETVETKVEEPVKEKTTLNNIREEFNDTAYQLAKKQIEKVGEGYVNLDRVKENANKIIQLGQKDKGVAIAEALQYEFGYADNWSDLRNAIKKGGVKNNYDSIKRFIEVGIELPKDILDKYNEYIIKEPQKTIVEGNKLTSNKGQQTEVSGNNLKPETEETAIFAEYNNARSDVGRDKAIAKLPKELQEKALDVVKNFEDYLGRFKNLKEEGKIEFETDC